MSRKARGDRRHATQSTTGVSKLDNLVPANHKRRLIVFSFERRESRFRERCDPPALTGNESGVR